MDEERKLESVLEKWWRYRMWSAAILLVVLVALGALITMNTHTVSYDFYVGVVTEAPLSQEALDNLQQRLNAAGWDRNHDNAVQVLIWEYAVNLNPDSLDASDESGLEQIKSDLGSKRSGLFLVDNPVGMPVDADAVKIPGTDLYAMLSPGHVETKTYAEFLENLIG